MRKVVRVRGRGASSFTGALDEVLAANASAQNVWVEADGPSAALVERLSSMRDVAFVFEGAEDVAATLMGRGLRRGLIIPDIAGAHQRSDAFFRRFVTFRFATSSFRLHTRLQRLRLQSAAFDSWPDVPAETLASAAAFEATAQLSAGLAQNARWDPGAIRTVAGQCRILGIDRLSLTREACETVGGRELGVEIEGATEGASPHFLFVQRSGCAMEEIARAMARGQIVVAPAVDDLAERVGHLASGLTFAPAAPEALPFIERGQALRLSNGARCKARFGRLEWIADRERLQSMIVEDGRRWGTADPSANFVNQVRRKARARRLERWD